MTDIKMYFAPKHEPYISINNLRISARKHIPANPFVGWEYFRFP